MATSKKLMSTEFGGGGGGGGQPLRFDYMLHGMLWDTWLASDDYM